jgi:nitrogenase subunit NifH
MFIQEQITNDAIALEKEFRPSDIVLQTIKKGGGRNYIQKGAVLLGTYLLDQKAVKASADDFIRTEEKSCQDLGVEILETIFYTNETTRNDILEQTINHIITQHGPVDRYAQFLSHIIRERADLVIEYVEKFKELAEYLTFQKRFVFHVHACSHFPAK